MAICPFAKWEPLSRTSPAMTPTAVVVHSNAGTSGDLHGWWESNPDGLMSHFQIGIDGTIWQYVDTERQAYANVQANAYGISIESANNPGFGAMPQFDQDRWAGQQLASLVRLLQWIGITHPQIPMTWCTDGVHGIGAHDEFAFWTTPGHQCPGAARAAQLRDEIVPNLSRPAPSAPSSDEGFDMAITQKDLEDTVYRMTRKVLIDLGIDGDTANALKAATAALTEAKAANLYGIAANKKLDDAAAAEPPKA